jgi:hypothetical protein
MPELAKESIDRLLAFSVWIEMGAEVNKAKAKFQKRWRVLDLLMQSVDCFD